jgi:hypothetical protein
MTVEPPSVWALFHWLNLDRTYALQNEKSCKGGFIQTLGNRRKISKKTRPYDGYMVLPSLKSPTS